jgi:hypothetical protein
MIFLFYINDLPKVVYHNTEPILFADDTSIIVHNPNLVEFKNNLSSCSISGTNPLRAWQYIYMAVFSHTNTDKPTLHSSS